MIERQLINIHQSFCPQIRAAIETTMARFGLSWQETARLADRHTLAVQSWLASRSPQGKRFDGLGVTAVRTGIQASLLNLALGSHFPPETSEAVIDREIETVKSFFSQHTLPFQWWLSPLARPTDMGQRLLRRGFELGQYRLPTMVAPLSDGLEWPRFNPNIQVWPANSRADLAAASTIRRIAFQFAEGVALTYFEDMAEDWLKGQPARLYLARLGQTGPPTAIGALIIGAGLPGVYIMATLPASERQGLGKALLTHILSEAAAGGHELIVLTAGARAYSLYRKFGFEHIFEYDKYYLMY